MSGLAVVVLPKNPRFRFVALAFAGCAAFYVARAVALRIEPAHANLRVVIDGQVTEGDGWHPGEPFVTAHPVRAWGTWTGSDENTGTVRIGPFPASAHLRFGVGGYPKTAGIQLHAERVGTKEQFRIEHGDVGERWRIANAALPPAWLGEAILLVATDNAKQLRGWVALTEPIRGGRGTAIADLWQILLAGSIVLLLAGLILAIDGTLVQRLQTNGGRGGSHDPAAPVYGERVWPWIAGAIAVIPFLWCLGSFSELWWFGDEWDQLDQIARTGFWAWTVRPFGENVVPLFKSMWGALALSSGGSYLPMLGAVWLTHAVNTALFARLLRRAGFGWAGTALASVAFGLTVANCEILAWSVQWSNALAVVFLLYGLDWLLQHPPRAHAWDWRTNGVLALCAAASALAFVRGVLTGPILAFSAVFLSGRFGTHWRAAVVCLVPTAAIVGWIFLSATGNHNQLGRDVPWLHAIEFAAWFWAAVPFHRLFDMPAWDGQTTLLLGTVKLVFVVWALRRTHGAQRQVLVLLLLFDLGNAALLGLGRHQTGLQFANSSRYYYNALVCTLPFAAFVFDAAVGALPWRGWRRLAATAVAVFVAVRVARPWPHEVGTFAEWRGRNTRQILLRDPHPPAEGAVPGIPFLRTERAKELIEIYHLH